MKLTRKNIIKVIEDNFKIGKDITITRIKSERSGNDEYNIRSTRYKEINVYIYSFDPTWEENLIKYFSWQFHLKTKGK